MTNKEFKIEELEKIKLEIIKEKCNKCEVDYNICYEINIVGWCDVFDNLTIIDNRIKELKKEMEENSSKNIDTNNEFNSFAIYFHDICPYTKKKCDDWNCSKCEVEITEQEFAEGD